MLAWTIKNKKSCKKTAILVVGFFMAVFLFLNLAPALAQVDVPGASPTGPDTFGLEQVGGTIALPATDIRLIIARIIRAVLGLLGIITIVIMMYAGFTWMTSGGNEEKIIKAKRTMINATIGIAIILSAFSIVQFLINMFAGQFQPGVAPDFVKKPYINTYSGSGSLGTIIKDHYPMRDQIGVKRNTSIMVTFAEPVDPSSLIENTNGSCWNESYTGPTTTDCNFDTGSIPFYGDCVDDEYNNNYYAENCDMLITSSTEIYMSDDENKILVEAAAMTSYDSNGDAYSFVFKPLEPIGNSTDDVWYTVDLLASILKKKLEGVEQTSVFSGSFSGHYLWEFQTDVNFDFEPPHVVSARPPASDTNIPRNRVIQIFFNEPVNPLSVQGVFNGDSFFDNIVINRENTETGETEVVPGEWKISNGYTTVSFVSDESCGYNSCGEMMYCLPIDCNENQTDCYNPYRVLLRTALLLPNSVDFQSYPLSGVMDTADNALDGNNDGEADDRPTVGQDGNTKFIGIGEGYEVVDGEAVPDDYYWNFAVKNRIDREAPFVRTVSPNLDQGAVSEKTPIMIYFSKVMLHSSLDNLRLIEHPDDSLDDDGKPIPKEQRNFYFDNIQATGKSQGSCFLVGDDLVEDKRCLDTMWYVDRSKLSANATGTSTVTNLLHRDLGPNGYDFYYMPEIPSTIVDENQNCIYPGYGPDTIKAGKTSNCQVNYDKDGKIIKFENGDFDIPGCVDVNFTSSTDTGCIQTTTGDSDDKLQPKTATCIEFLKEESI